MGLAVEKTDNLMWEKRFLSTMAWKVSVFHVHTGCPQEARDSIAALAKMIAAALNLLIENKFTPIDRSPIEKLS